MPSTIMKLLFIVAKWLWKRRIWDPSWASLVEFPLPSLWSALPSVWRPSSAIKTTIRLTAQDIIHPILWIKQSPNWLVFHTTRTILISSSTAIRVCRLSTPFEAGPVDTVSTFSMLDTTKRKLFQFDPGGVDWHTLHSLISDLLFLE